MSIFQLLKVLVLDHLDALQHRYCKAPHTPVGMLNRLTRLRGQSRHPLTPESTHSASILSHRLVRCTRRPKVGRVGWEEYDEVYQEATMPMRFNAEYTHSSDLRQPCQRYQRNRRWAIT